MLVMEKPGCCGAAARLPKKPGTQKLTPPSSAAATVGVMASAPRTSSDALRRCANPSVAVVVIVPTDTPPRRQRRALLRLALCACRRQPLIFLSPGPCADRQAQTSFPAASAAVSAGLLKKCRSRQTPPPLP